MRVNPECRYCGTRVEFFGDICGECKTFKVDGVDNDDFAAITHADLHRLSERGDT